MGLMDTINNCKTYSYRGFQKELEKQDYYDLSDIKELAELFKKYYTIYRKNNHQRLIEVVDNILVVLDFGNKRKFVKDIKKNETIIGCDIDEQLDIDFILDYCEKL
jgi:hypothetical protein